MCPADPIFENARRHLYRVDPLLKKHTMHIKVAHRRRPLCFASLCDIIISQHISVAAANAIRNRLRHTLGGTINLKTFTAANDADLFRAGLTQNKTKSLRSLAQLLKDKPSYFASLRALNDQDAIKRLTQIRGIGPWSARMCLMFLLGRQDVYGEGDSALNRAMIKIYGDAKPKTIAKKCALWSPYTTFSCLLLWAVAVELQPLQA